MSTYLNELQRLKLYGKQVEQKKRYTIPKKSQKKIAAEAVEKASGGNVSKLSLDKWFDDIRI